MATRSTSSGARRSTPSAIRSNPHILLEPPALRRLRAAAPPARRSRSSASHAPAILDLLQEHGHLREVKGRWYYTREDYPAAGVSLRNAGENVYTILDTSAAGESGAAEAPASRGRPA